ncbi:MULTISPECIES: hypothetical protein [unclassified Bradyrhizobium]|nr:MULTISPECIES: hypothetical protein [unclassified Bradyrhizobium]MBR1281907.1 hypothetical protein [Bradyrhizobium sp. AUGA SZCCT0177]MBR1297694.1 hypothetical protein [Bradyrhizobium sp. AUGA SZCCT0042]
MTQQKEREANRDKAETDKGFHEFGSSSHSKNLGMAWPVATKRVSAITLSALPSIPIGRTRLAVVQLPPIS